MGTSRVLLRSTGIFLGQAVFLAVILAMLAMLSGCAQIPGITYSIDEQFALSRARAVELNDQLQFSFRLDPASVSVGQDIFLGATFTNTTDHPIVFREPEQNGVFAFEDFDTLLLFAVEPISKDLSLLFPGQGLVDRIVRQPTLGEFVELPAHMSREIRLQLPHEAQVKHAPANVFAMFSAEYVPLPVGQYQVQMTYINDVIGNETRISNEFVFVDLHAWVGRKASSLVLLTVTP